MSPSFFFSVLWLGAGVSPEWTISPLPRLSADLAGVDAVTPGLPVSATATPPAAAAPNATLLFRSFLTGDEVEDDLRAGPFPPSLSLLPILLLLDFDPILLNDRATLFNDLVGDEPRDDATDGDGMTPRKMEYEPVMDAELAVTTDSPSPGGVTKLVAAADTLLRLSIDRSSTMALSPLLALRLPLLLSLSRRPARNGVATSLVYVSTNRSGVDLVSSLLPPDSSLSGMMPMTSVLDGVLGSSPSSSGTRMSMSSVETSAISL